MTVVIDTPEGVKTGSAVREVQVREQHNITPETVAHVSVNGEAVVVDLGERGKVFALLSSGYRGSGYSHAHQVVFSTFPSEHGGTTSKGMDYYSTLKNAKAVLTPIQYPRLVTLPDVKDPKTVRLLLDAEVRQDRGTSYLFIKNDYFEDAFGKGVKLKEISIEMTDEPVTENIRSEVPAFPTEGHPEFNNFMKWHRSMRYGDLRKISNSDFKRQGHTP